MSKLIEEVEKELSP